MAASSPAVKLFNQRLGKGLNLGNLLEAPSEGAWGVNLMRTDLDAIAAKKFQHVRAPIRWDGLGDDTDHTFQRALRTPPYTVDPRFFARVDSMVAWTRRNHLMLVLNDHHHDSLFQNFEHEAPRFLAIWDQIAAHFKDLPTDSVAFEILNEPNGQVTAERWNRLVESAIKLVRKTNPDRPVVVGTTDWGGPGGLAALTLPVDSNLILTVHDYDPKGFVYQGASWIEPVMPVGVKWGGYWDLKQAIEGADAIAAYAKERDLPVYIGEFGTTYKSDKVSRGAWAATKARLFEERGFSWAWWSYKEREMGLLRTATIWDPTFLTALFSTDTSILALGEPPKNDRDLIRNGSFADTTGWKFVQLDRGAGRFRVDSGVAVTKVDSCPLKEGWEVEICQVPLSLKAGNQYQLTFLAWSDSATTIDAWVGHGEDPWPMYASSGAIALERSPKRFHTVFQVAEDDSMGEVCINMGVNPVTIRVDSVQLFEYALDVPVRAGSAKPGHAIRRVGTEIVSDGFRPKSEWLVDSRGCRVQRLEWKASARGWIADVAKAPRGRLLFLDREAWKIVVGD
ncbi:MAG: hypothetical protein RL173_1712 [Fibrobacterota bacterium]|jgi:aryl-phospho-beta-D-glucosidase BglC (GH1 family)